MVELESILKYAALFAGVVVIAGAVSFFVAKKVSDPTFIQAEARAEVDRIMTAALQRISAQNTKKSSKEPAVAASPSQAYYYQL